MDHAKRAASNGCGGSRGAGIALSEPFASQASSTAFRRLADRFGLTRLGVNMVTLAPGAQSGLRHWHSLEDEFIYILEGEVTLRRDAGDFALRRGMCIGFKAQDRNAHLVLNRSDAVAHYLVIGSRVPGDVSLYPDDDLAWLPTEEGDKAVHRDGRPYPPPAKEAP